VHQLANKKLCLQYVLEFTQIIGLITLFCILNIVLFELSSPPTQKKNVIPNYYFTKSWAHKKYQGVQQVICVSKDKLLIFLAPLASKINLSLRIHY
jgi:formate-dependent nitrite reductase membrane component NrfD